MTVRRLLAITLPHLTANLVLLGAGYYWLGVGESSTSTLLWSGLLAFLWVLFGCCAYSAPLAYFRDRNVREIGKAWRNAARNLIPFVVVALVIAIAVVFLNRHGVKPVTGIRKWAVWTGEWVLIPVLFLPVLSAISERGWQGFRAAGSRMRQWLFWVEAPLLLLLTVRVPLMLLQWVPGVRSFALQAASFSARAAAAYLIFGAGWVLLAWVTSGGTPRLNQPSTVGAP